jgi:flagellar biogenesis protein FliO
MDPIQPMAAIVFVAALLGGALFLLKKRSSPALPGLHRLEVIERVPLGPQHALHLVRAGDRMVLIATGPSSCQLLDHAVSTGEKA